MIKRYTSNINFDFYLDAARKLHINFRFLIKNKPIGYFYKGKKRLYITYNKLGTNNCVSYMLATNKFRTYKVLDQKNFPRPRSSLIKEAIKLEKVFQNIKKLSKPWVVKPLKGSGGFGVSVNLTQRSQLKKAIKFARRYYKNIIIEEFIKGKHFRILVFKNKILDVLERIPAHIIGDGTHLVKALIGSKNKKRKKLGLKPIKIDYELQKELSDNKLTLKSKLEKDKKVFLRENCNLSTGGETRRIKLSSIHKDNQELFLESVNLLGLNFAGIDFIIPDITKSYKKTRCAINEINKAPMLDAHYFANMKMDNFAAETILNMYFYS